jgi:uncharacterized protein (TIGR00255 family)
MISSMTGFGRAEVSFEGGTFTVEIRSVNHRYTDFTIRVPRSLSNFEPEIKELLKKRVQRGYLNLQLTWDRAEENTAFIDLDEKVIRRYQELFRRMNEEFGIGGQPTVETFSRLSDVFKVQSEPEDGEKLLQMVEQVVNLSLDALLEMRAREGEVLAQDILRRLDGMALVMEQSGLRGPERLARVEARLRDKVTSLLGGQTEVDPARLLQEVTFYADKWDFSEEDVRFRSHLDAIRETLKNGGAVGRKLNFLIQELNREVNTVASKSNDAGIAQQMVTLKEEIEKIREQIENIE